MFATELNESRFQASHNDFLVVFIVILQHRAESSGGNEKRD